MKDNSKIVREEFMKIREEDIKEVSVYVSDPDSMNPMIDMRTNSVIVIANNRSEDKTLCCCYHSGDNNTYMNMFQALDSLQQKMFKQMLKSTLEKLDMEDSADGETVGDDSSEA